MASNVSPVVVSGKPENGFPSELAREHEICDASTLVVISNPEDDLPLARTCLPATSLTWTPVSNNPFCKVFKITTLLPFTDCVVPVNVLSMAGTGLVLPERVQVHGLVTLPVVYDGQFMLCIINTKETTASSVLRQCLTVKSHLSR